MVQVNINLEERDMQRLKRAKLALSVIVGESVTYRDILLTAIKMIERVTEEEMPDEKEG